MWSMKRPNDQDCRFLVWQYHFHNKLTKIWVKHYTLSPWSWWIWHCALDWCLISNLFLGSFRNVCNLHFVGTRLCRLWTVLYLPKWGCKYWLRNAIQLRNRDHGRWALGIRKPLSHIKQFTELFFHGDFPTKIRTYGLRLNLSSSNEKSPTY